MATLSESKFREEAQKKKLRALYVIASEDAYKLDFYAELLFKSWDGGGPKDIRYADEISPELLLEDLQTGSLFSPSKFLLVRHGERMQAKQWEVLLPLLSEPAEKSCLVILCAKVDARFKFFQALAKADQAAALVKLELPDASECQPWLSGFLKENGKDMEPAARDLCLAWASGELSDLKHLVERACLYAGEELVVRREHVQAVGMRLTPEEVFQFTGNLLSGDRAASLARLEALLEQGEEPLALVGLLARQYRWLLDILTLRAEGEGDAAIASKAGIFPGAAKVLFPAARRLGSKGVIRGLSALSQTDYRLKSSRLSKNQLLTELVLELTA
jgi:DNA polymerase-3 subunit delta